MRCIRVEDLTFVGISREVAIGVAQNGLADVTEITDHGTPDARRAADEQGIAVDVSEACQAAFNVAGIGLYGASRERGELVAGDGGGVAVEYRTHTNQEPAGLFC